MVKSESCTCMDEQNNHHFNSPTYGILTVEDVHKRIVTFMKEDPQARYHFVIGTDSQQKNGDEVDFVTAFVVHRIGTGGIYFWRRLVENKRYVLRQRIYTEATLSLSAAEEFMGSFKKNGISDYEVEIHVDVGKVGETREMLAEVVGMVRGSGFRVKVKPESYGASKVADRHT